MRIYPAYGLTFARMITRGLRPQGIGVLLSSRWNYFLNAPRVCIRPDEWAERKWEFGFLRNQHVVAILGEEVEPWQFCQLLVELMAAGPRLLWACNYVGEWYCKDEEPMALQALAVEGLRGHVAAADWRGPDYTSSHAARKEYERAQARAASLDSVMANRIVADGGNLATWLDEQQAQRAAVERTFSYPYAVPEDAVAA